MKIISGIDTYPKIYSQTAIALGTFDGVHLGHQKLISTLKTEAKTNNLISMVFTFYPHPLRVVNPQLEPPMITSLEERADLIAGYGIDYFLVANFDQNFASMSPEDFIVEILHNKLKVKTVVVGFNYTFGYKGLGTPEMLKQFGEKLGYKTIVVEPVSKNGIIVSSTEIRRLVSEGDISLAAQLLGRSFFLEGKVVKGDGRGKNLGFPTANLSIPQEMVIPNNGVYAVKVVYAGKEYPGGLNIGTKPTFAGKSKTIEVNIIGFSEDIYGKTLRVEFLKKLRDERVFDSPSQLIAQISSDTKAVLQVYKDYINKTKEN
jgi:riboflavin kinase/FMN adenylyltransferase